MKFHSLRNRIENALTGEPGEPEWTRWLKAAATISAITILGDVVDLRVAPTNLAMLYLLGVVFICYRWGFGPALLSSLAGAFAFDFYFIPPYESFAVSDLWYFVTALTFMCIAVLISILTAEVRRHALNASRRAENTAALCALAQTLAMNRRPEDVLRATEQHIETRFGYQTAILLVNESGQLVTKLEPSGRRIDDSLRAAAETAVHFSGRGPLKTRLSANLFWPSRSLRLN